MTCVSFEKRCMLLALGRSCEQTSARQSNSCYARCKNPHLLYTTRVPELLPGLALKCNRVYQAPHCPDTTISFLSRDLITDCRRATRTRGVGVFHRLAQGVLGHPNEILVSLITGIATFPAHCHRLARCLGWRSRRSWFPAASPS